MGMDNTIHVQWLTQYNGMYESDGEFITTRTCGSYLSRSCDALYTSTRLCSKRVISRYCKMPESIFNISYYLGNVKQNIINLYAQWRSQRGATGQLPPPLEVWQALRKSANLIIGAGET